MNKPLSIALSLISVVGAIGTAHAKSVPLSHSRLITAIESAGFKVYINHEICDDDKAPHGLYIEGNVVICQQNVKAGDREINPDWTANDLDTIRHEIHHAVQDCQLGENQDSILGHVYEYPIKYATKVFGQEGINYVREAYPNATERTKLLEIEAFAVAHQNDIDEQISDIKRYCFID